MTSVDSIYIIFSTSCSLCRQGSAREPEGIRIWLGTEKNFTKWYGQGFPYLSKYKVLYSGYKWDYCQ